INSPRSGQSVTSAASSISILPRASESSGSFSRSICMWNIIGAPPVRHNGASVPYGVVLLEVVTCKVVIYMLQRNYTYLHHTKKGVMLEELPYLGGPYYAGDILGT